MTTTSTDRIAARAAKAKALRAEVKRHNRMDKVYAAASPSGRAAAAMDVWRAEVKRLDPRERDAHYERIAEQLVNDALQLESDTTRREVA